MKKKCFDIISALFVISILAFIFIHLIPGEPAENYLRASHLPVTDTLLKQKRKELGLDLPYIIQYLNWLKNVLVGNFGNSFARRTSAIQLVLESLYSTFQLSLFSIALILLISFPLGLFSALKNNSFMEKIIRIFSFFAVSMPVFWLGFHLMLLFGVKWKLLPVSGKESIKHIILPSITLALPFIGQYTAFIKKSIVEQNQQKILENAILRGLKKRYLIFHYLIKAAWLPIFTAFSLSFVYILTGSILVEEIFAWPGIGVLFVKSLQIGDIPVIQACIILFGSLFIFVNTTMDLLLQYLDPRIRRRGKK